MNLKPRIADPEKLNRLRSRELPAQMEPPLLPAPLHDETTVEPVSSVKPAESQEKSELEQKLDDYQAPLLFSMLLTAPRSRPLIELLENNLRQAKQKQDELYEAIFEGVLAANQTPPDLSQAVRSYHRAFDISDRSDGPRDGFLYSMAWSMFAGSASDHEVSALLERARAEPRSETPLQQQNSDLLRQTANEFRAMPVFAPSQESFQVAEEDRIRRLHRHLVRPGRFSNRVPLLLFPKTVPYPDRIPGFRAFANQTSFGNYFLYSNGCGTVIDPDLSFLDEFYRIGGSLRDIRNVVFSTDSGRLETGVLRQFQTLFGIYYRESWDAAKLSFFVTPELIRRHEAEFQEFTTNGIAESVLPLNDASGTEIPGRGILLYRNGSLQVKIRTSQDWWSTVQFLSPLGPEQSVDPDGAVPSCNVSIFAIRTQDDLYWAAAQARRCRSPLTLFDFPPESRLRLLEEPLREFLGTELRFAPLGNRLACDLQNNRFSDIVKSAEAPDGVGWSDFRDIAFELSSPVPDSNDFCYFERPERFREERSDILEAFRYRLNRRLGLYFS